MYDYMEIIMAFTMVGITIVSLVLGVLFFHFVSYRMGKITSGVGASFLTVLGGLFFVATVFIEGYFWLMVIFGLISEAGGIVIVIVANAQRAKERKIAFYKECERNGIQECRSEKEIQKATLIAQKHRMQYTNVSALFYEAKAAAFNSKKEEEKKQFDALNKYADLTGRDKRIAMLSYERAEALKNAKSAKRARAGAQAIIDSTQEKEYIWAIQRYAPLITIARDNADAYDSRARGLMREIEKAKTKLVSKDNAKTCFSKISFSNTEIEVSETGTCTVTASAKLTSPMIIFDDVPAIVDGTVIAMIYDGNTLVGTASLVLPKYGITEKEETTLKGMCLYCGTKDRNYIVQYAATNLWAMER